MLRLAMIAAAALLVSACQPGAGRAYGPVHNGAEAIAVAHKALGDIGVRAPEPFTAERLEHGWMVTTAPSPGGVVYTVLIDPRTGRARRVDFSQHVTIEAPAPK